MIEVEYEISYEYSSEYGYLYNYHYILPMDLFEAMRQEVRDDIMGFRTLYILRRLMGFQEHVVGLTDQTFLNGINAITSECDFDEYPGKDEVKFLGKKEYTKREAELSSYFRDCNMSGRFLRLLAAYEGHHSR